MCFDVVFVFENIRTCLFTRVFMYFLHLVFTFTPHYIIMVKGLLVYQPPKIIHTFTELMEKLRVHECINSPSGADEI